MKTKIAKGFTLVEIMVVIVIMGILAAIAVPKLFGSIAKAKASEIAPAAGTYQRLQDVHIASYGSVGTWNSIGYVAPGNGKTNNFTYCGGEITEDIEADKFGETSKVGWQATNNVGLNGCSAGSWWFVSVKPEDSHNTAYTNETNATECIALAKPSWTVASRSGMSCGEAGSVEESALKPTDVGYTMTMGTPQKGGWSLSGGGVNHNVDKSQYATNNPDREDGLYVLEGNSTYTFTIEVDAKDANGKEIWPGDSYMQTAVRVYTDPEATGNAAIVCGSVKEENKAEKDPEAYNKGWVDGNGNGYNTGSGQGKGYTAEATIKREGDKYVTTVTITTGNDGGYFGANFLAVGNGGYGSDGSTRRTATQEAIEKATLSLTKTGGTSSK